MKTILKAGETFLDHLIGIPLLILMIIVYSLYDLFKKLKNEG